MSPFKVGLLACLLSTMPAQAAVISYNATGGNITDNGTTAFSFSIGDDFNITDLDVVMSINHTFLGDLKIVLTGPGSTSVTLMDRPGVPTLPFGSSANLSQDFSIVFDDGGTVDSEQMGEGCGTSTSIVGSSCQVGVRFSPVDLLARFENTSAMGDWFLTITDSAAQDVGSLAGYSLRFTTDGTPLPAPVPEPATLALLGLGLFGIAASRRKKLV